MKKLLILTFLNLFVSNIMPVINLETIIRNNCLPGAIKYLEKHPEVLNTPFLSVKGWTPLHMCSVSPQHLTVMSHFLVKGANPNVQDEDGLSPLLVAACQGNLEGTRLLLYFGANVDHMGKKGQTPLNIAAAQGRLNIVKELVELGTANINKLDITGSSPRTIAVASGHSKIDEYLEKIGGEIIYEGK